MAYSTGKAGWTVKLLFFLLYVHGSQGLRCHQCSGVTDPHFCSMVVHCAADEECHTEKVIGEESAVFYNSGCQKIQLCQLAANGKRSDLHVCEGCCGTDLCNAELCPASNSTSPGIQCYQCDQVDSPQDCHNRVTCADGEQCIVQEYANDKMEVKYSLGCETKQRCGLLQKLGKRSTTQICNECCDTPGCNRHLCENGNSTNSSCKDEPDMDCKLADDTQNICADRTLAAVKYCQKYCGYCSADGSTMPPPTGTTVDTCKDSGDLDCKQMNDSLHLCAKKDSPPAILYCPKFCGICTPTSQSGSTGPSGCKDSPDVDCKMANETQNICALRTLAATKYCPKFCDYCSADGSTHATLPPPTGVTADPCRDSGDMDCKKMNDSLNICSKPNSPPTLLYCPKFCGLCTPACSDSADVDCKLANDTHNICAQGTIAAKNYCPKFCGYCSADGSTHTPPPHSGSTANPCQDTGDVDCKQMDDNLGICAKKDSPPTQMYCPKYCGICQ
ncbi:uncharacterized protein LOC123545841 [Mercenaria mercenaria]|uniref:uncharacterized protein LOC123545841 n=1 Tax=Mercenaria mercenaria TaxID=6596 RepID=UPI001E1E0D53|nr:uncharacterized protein LOC123545841 [Mercenaria mercenaria]